MSDETQPYPLSYRAYEIPTVKMINCVNMLNEFQLSVVHFKLYFAVSVCG